MMLTQRLARTQPSCVSQTCIKKLGQKTGRILLLFREGDGFGSLCNWFKGLKRFFFNYCGSMKQLIKVRSRIIPARRNKTHLFQTDFPDIPIKILQQGRYQISRNQTVSFGEEFCPLGQIPPTASYGNHITSYWAMDFCNDSRSESCHGIPIKHSGFHSTEAHDIPQRVPICVCKNRLSVVTAGSKRQDKASASV